MTALADLPRPTLPRPSLPDPAEHLGPTGRAALYRAEEVAVFAAAAGASAGLLFA